MLDRNTINTPTVVSYKSLDDEIKTALLPQVVMLESELHATSGWDSDSIKQSLDNTFGQLWLLVNAEYNKYEIIAYCLFQQVFEQAEIFRIGTSKNHQKQGWASCLLTQLCEFLQQTQCETLLLEVRADNLPAINLYAKHGFEQIDIRKNYYKESSKIASNETLKIDALILQKRL